MSQKSKEHREKITDDIMDEDTTDSLDIKPPQAQRMHKMKKTSKDKYAKYKHRSLEGYEEKSYKHRESSRESSHKSGHYDKQYYKERSSRDAYYKSQKHQEEPSEADRMADEMLQDLRSKLLMKRHKSSESAAEQQHHHQSEKSKKRSKNRDLEEKEEWKAKRSKQIENDEELLARKSRILKAEREMTQRKEMARKELEARRDKLSEKAAYKTDKKDYKPYADHDDDDEDDDDDEEDEVVMVSDHSEESISPVSSPECIGREDDPKKSSERRERDQSDKEMEDDRSNTSKSPRDGSDDDTEDHSSSTSDDEDEEEEEDNEPRDVPMEQEKDQKSPENKEKPEKKEEIVNDLPSYYPAIQGCRSVEEFQCLNRIEEGTYGVVYRAKDKRTDEVVALKRLKMEKEKEGFPITSLREINTLLKGQHPNIVTVREIVVGSNMDKIFIVMDYVEHDLKSLIETMKHKKQSFLPGEVKCLLQQLLRAVAHLHDNWILHRDLKTSNLLLSHKGILKVGDFGLAREYGSPLKHYTPIVVTLWYRAPELLLCCKEYSTPIDVWSVGCIFAELLTFHPLFPGKSELDQLNRIFKDLGTPNEKIWPGYNELPAVQKMTFTEYPVSNLRKKFFKHTSEFGLALLQGLLTYDPKQRLTAEAALKSNYFKELPLPIDPAMFPTWPAKSELGLKKALASSPKPPSGGGEYKRLGEDINVPGGFTLSAGPGFSLRF
ncbi:cyclin-dependent kinase 11B [Culicoides brevitarsis]|uniref:cyclin-dependent kinase 11B n=1 Tax=Culicoides brevitarsis TaxID=469753 RepID=UPI00307B3F57